MNPRSPALSPLAPRAVSTPAQWAEHAPSPPTPDTFNLGRWITVFRRRFKIFAVILVLGVATTLVYTLLQTPMYTGVAPIALNVRDEQLISLPESPKAELPLDRDASLVDTQVEILRSPRLAAWVVDHLKLDQDPEFIGSPSPFTQRIARLGFPGASAAADSPEARRRRAIGTVASRMSVVRVGSTYVIQARFKSPNPQKAARIADTFAEGYLAEQRRVRVEDKKEAANWLQGRLGELRGQVQSAEAAVAQFKIANNLMSAAGQNLTDQEISTYNQAAAQARAVAAEADSRLRAARNQLARGASGETMGEALGSVVIQNLRTQRAQASAKLATLQSRYGDRHPDLIRAQQEVADIDAQIQQEVSRVLSSLQTNASAAHERLASIQGSVAGARGALVSNNRAGIQLAELERNAQAVRSLYESFLGRYKEISSQEGITSADARVVSNAPVPGVPTSPNVPMNLAIGTLLAAALGLAGVLLRELSDSTLSTADDVHRRLMMPYLGGLPLLESITKRRDPPTAHIAAYPTSGFTEAVRALGAALRYAQATPPKVVLLTSALPNEGKTVTAICLARTLALQGHKVIYVDCDLRRASGTASIGVRPTAGLLEVLDGEVELERVIFRDSATGASFLPLKLPQDGSRDVFGLPATDALLERLRSEYEMVILDTAPVLAIAETRILARKADAVALLAAWRQTPQKAVENALDILETVGAPVTGLALTKVDLRVQMKTGYGDPAMFYRQYASYYTDTPRLPALT